MSVPTTRELNVKTIFTVTAVSVSLLIAIVYTARAGYQYFAHRDAERKWNAGSDQTFAEYGVRIDHRDLAELNHAQRSELTDGTEGRMPIGDAMKAVSQRYARDASPAAPAASPAAH